MAVKDSSLKLRPERDFLSYLSNSKTIKDMTES